MRVGSPSDAAAVAGAPAEHGYDRCSATGGPGQALTAYLPNNMDLRQKREATLTPSAESEAATLAYVQGLGQRREATPRFQS